MWIDYGNSNTSILSNIGLVLGDGVKVAMSMEQPMAITNMDKLLLTIIDNHFILAITEQLI